MRALALTRIVAPVLALTPFAVAVASAQQPSTPSELRDDETPDEATEPDASVSTALAPSPVLAEGEMIRIPGATFTMGSSDPKSPANERPRHVETVAAFFIDKTEVSVGAYRRCVDSHACTRPARSSPACTFDAGDDRLPVSCVHWRDAEAYCRDVGKRLPREPEWELAARGPKGGRYPWRGPAAGCYSAYTIASETTGRTCTRGPSRVGAHPAGASLYGVLDMAGNVEEWTSDWYADNLALGSAPASGASHVLRGGGWQSAPSASRTTSRSWGSAIEAGPNVGFRCAKSP